MPGSDRLAERLDGVLRVVYLVFNEGYAATSGDALVRRELCNEATRMGRVLCAPLPAASELVVLEDQDRSLWDRGQIGTRRPSWRSTTRRRWRWASGSSGGCGS